MRHWIWIILILFAAMPALAQTDYYVSPVGDDLYDGLAPVWDGTHGPKVTIQAAVNAAAANDIVHIAPGTYTSTAALNLNKSGLKLYGPQAHVDPRPSQGSARVAGSVNEAIISGASLAGSVNIIYIAADHVEVNGLEVCTGPVDMVRQSNAHIGTMIRYCIIHDGNGDEGVQLVNSTNALLEYNYVFDIAWAGDGLNLASSTGGIIRHNELTNINTDNAAIYIYSSNNTTIEGNYIHHLVNGEGIKLGNKSGADAGLHGGVIRNNTIEHVGGPNEDDCICVYTSNVLLEGNDCSNAYSQNGSVYFYFAISNITFRYNKVHDNTLSTAKTPLAAGVFIGSNCNVATFSIYDNDIYNNTPYNMTNAAAAEVNAENNWWGSNEGPEDPTGTTEVALGDVDPGGAAPLLNAAPAGLLGNLVSNNTVDYFPWRATPFYGATIAPTEVYHSAAVGSGTVTVTAPAGMNWTAVSNDPSWLTVTSGANGSGNGTVDYAVSFNPTATMRTGTITIAGQTFTVHQYGIVAASQPLFWATRTSVWPYGIIQFEDVSGLAATSWFWEFGDGQTSTLQNPLIMFTKSGIYSIKLTITTATEVVSYSKKKLITVYGYAAKPHATLELVHGSESHLKETWENAIDEDISGWNGTASVKGDPPYAVFKFKDGTDKIMDRIRLLTDTDMGYPDRWAFEFHVQVSSTGLADADFVTVFAGHKKHGSWEEFTFSPVLARYIKLVVDTPALGWRQIGEFQVCPVRRYADPNQSETRVSTPHLANGIDAATVTLTVKESSGTMISGLTWDDFHFITYPGAVQYSEIRETAPGVYSVQMTSTVAGVHTFTCYVDGIKIGEDPVVFNPASLKKASLVLVDHSNAYYGEGWDNAIDGVETDWDGTVTAGPDQPWAIFAFSEGQAKMVQKLNLITDTGVGYDQRWVRAFRILVSSTGTEPDDFTLVYKGTQTRGGWQTHGFVATAAKYVKFIVDAPASGWKQLGELEILAAEMPAGAAQASATTAALAMTRDFSVRNYPNPFNPETTIELALPEATHACIEVYNMLGQMVRRLLDSEMTAGMHRVRWDGRDHAGRTLPSGLYSLRTRAGSEIKVQRMLMVK